MQISSQIIAFCNYYFHAFFSSQCKQKVYCPEGHLFRHDSFKDIASNPHSPYRFGTRCDICSIRLMSKELFEGEGIYHAEISDGIYHCDLCRFELCSQCFGGIRNFCQKCHFCGKNESIVLIRSGDPYSRSWTCDMCKRTDRTRFELRCQECGRVMCSKCFKTTAVCCCCFIYKCVLLVIMLMLMLLCEQYEKMKYDTTIEFMRGMGSRESRRMTGYSGGYEHWGHIECHCRNRKNQTLKERGDSPIRHSDRCVWTCCRQQWDECSCSDYLVFHCRE